MTGEEQKLAGLFFPRFMKGRERLRTGTRLAHYTTAETGYRIIENKEVWLRNAMLMNDFSEIQHGLRCIVEAWRSTAGANLRDLMDRIDPELGKMVENAFDQNAPGMQAASFIMSFSEHDSEEDDLGRLSMWRAYGGKNGVALILNPEIFLSQTDEIGAVCAPVNYLTVDDFTTMFENWVASLIEHEELLRNIGPNEVLGRIYFAFRVFALCTKHPGFREEQEWRVFHSPLHEQKSTDWLRKENEVVGGVPQEVVKIKLKDDETKGVTNLALDGLLERLIIGPCQFPDATYHALSFALQEAGVADPNSRLQLSNIPLRT